MNGNDLILDANAAIAIFSGNKGIGLVLEGKRRLLPSIVYGELFFGALKSTRQEENLERLDDLVAQCDVISVDLRTGRKFGELRLSLVRKGKPIPENDLWIAALALQHSAPLATNDSHFDVVDGLELVKW